MTHASSERQAERAARIGKIAAVVLFFAMLAAPTPTGMTPEAQRLAAVTLMMAALWLTNAIPIAATSLIPLVAFPLLGIQDSAVVSKSYIDRNIFLFLGGFIVALGIEKWGLHRRMALHIVRVVGAGQKTVILGFMCATAFLSMWISNTASTLLMLPIGIALVASLKELASQDDSEAQSENSADAPLEAFAVALMLAIAYSASIGGFTTLVGTPTNLQFIKIWNDMFPVLPEHAQIDVANWMRAVLPVGLFLLVVTWGMLVCRLREIPGTESLDRGFFRDRLKRLGPPTRAEWLMLTVFAATALLWILRPFLSRRDLLPPTVHDSTIAMGMAVLMFFIPARTTAEGRTQFLMDWPTAERLPWGILLLIGGGFAIASGFQDTHLSDWIGTMLAEAAAGWPPWLLVASVCLLMTFLTEFTSNVATVAAVLPVLGATALSLDVDPRLVMIPATLSASCAFMLPIATPPNAIVFGSGKIRMQQMVRHGVWLNFIGAIVITTATFFVLAPALGIDLRSAPEWASQGATEKP